MSDCIWSKPTYHVCRAVLTLCVSFLQRYSWVLQALVSPDLHLSWTWTLRFAGPAPPPCCLRSAMLHQSDSCSLIKKGGIIWLEKGRETKSQFRFWSFLMKDWLERVSWKVCQEDRSKQEWTFRWILTSVSKQPTGAGPQPLAPFYLKIKINIFKKSFNLF